jgi:Niemann-Pick C1 protein
MREKNETEESDLFQKRYLEKIYALQSKIENGQFDYLGKTYRLLDFCYRPVASKGCMITSPMDFWKMNITQMRADPDIKETGRCLQTEIGGDLPCFDRLGTPVQLTAIFGKQDCLKGEPNGYCDLCKKGAKSLAVTFLLNHNTYYDEVAMIWERDIFQKAILEFNEEEEKSKSNVYLHYLMERSVPDELDKENSQNIGIVILSYVLMFVYISLSMGEFPSIMFSRVLVALGGIFVVVLSFTGAIAIVSYMGVRMSLISAEVVPFLVLAIGVDNMFIITGAKDRKKTKPNIHRQNNKEMELVDQMAATLKEVGPSITTAAFSEVLAFIVGYLTKIPALQSFCLCAAFAVLINYFLQITIFFSIVTLDEIRVKAGRYDILPCFKQKKRSYDKKLIEPSLKMSDERSEIKLPKDEEEQSSNKRPRGKVRCQHFLSNSYLNFLMKLPVKICVLVLYLLLLGTSIAGMMFFPLGLDQRTTVIQNGDLYNYFNTQADYVDAGPPAYLVFYNIDYNNNTNLELIDNLIDHISFLDTVQPPVYSWYKEFKKFMNKDADWNAGESNCNPNLANLQTLPIELQVREFLKMKVDNEFCCMQNSVCGEPYKDDIAFGPDGRIEASRFRFAHIALRNQTNYVDSLLETRTITAMFKNNFTTYPDKPRNNFTLVSSQTIPIDTVYSYSLFYVYYDQYTFIRGVSVSNILIALASIFLAVQLIMNIKAALLVVLFTFSCVFNLIGVLWLLNFIPGYFIELNAVSVVNLILACGLSVEFTVHLIIFYFRCRKDNPLEKVRYAMKNVGVGVLIGIVTTKIIGNL